MWVRKRGRLSANSLPRKRNGTSPVRVEKFQTPGGQYISRQEAFSEGYEKVLSLADP